MKSKAYLVALFIFALLICFFTGCESGIGDPLGVLFGEIQIGSSGVEVGDFSFGDSQESVLSAEGLNEADVQIRDIADINSQIVVAQEKFVYDELDPYGAQKTFTFVDDSLTGIAYNVAYRDVPYEDAYASAMSVYEKVNSLIEEFNSLAERRDTAGIESVESGTLDSLSTVGGAFTKQWMFDGLMLSLNMNYQDMSEADFTDMDQFNLSVNFTQVK